MNKHVFIWGWAALIASYVVFVWTFIGAYSNESKSVTIYIDKFGEANIEMLLFMVTFLPALAVINKAFKDYKANLLTSKETHNS